MKRKTQHYTSDQLRRMTIWAHRADRACELIPPAATLIMVIQCALLYLDIRLPWAEAIVIFMGVLLTYLLSYALGYCRLHRAFILYNWAMFLCITYHREIGFGPKVHHAHILMLLIGLLLLLKLTIKKLRNK